MRTVRVSSRTVEALITGAVGLVAVIVVRWAPRASPSPGTSGGSRTATRRTPRAGERRSRSSGASSSRSSQRSPSGACSRSIRQTDQIVNALLASSAVLALFVGLAFSTPLSNLGSGLLVAFAQPLRLGDRVTVGGRDRLRRGDRASSTHARHGRRAARLHPEHAADDDDDRQPHDPRPARESSRQRSPSGSARPVDERASGGAQRRSTASTGVRHDETRVLVGDVKEGAVWLTATVSAPLDADVIQLGSRASARQSLGALGDSRSRWRPRAASERRPAAVRA